MTADSVCNSRNIPLPIQREVRQRCGFGCVICGVPLYEYEHLEEWAKVKRHVTEEITLLCDQHHREKTAKLLPKEVVREANSNPFNLKKGVSKQYDLHFSGKEAEITIGGNIFTCEDHGYGTAIIPISVDGTPLVGFVLGDRHLLLNLSFVRWSSINLSFISRITNSIILLFHGIFSWLEQYLRFAKPQKRYS